MSPITRPEVSTRNLADHGDVQTQHFKYLYVVLLGLLIAAIVLTNIVVALLDQRYDLSFDLTANAVYRAGEETKSLLRSLDRAVEIFVLAPEDSFGGNPYLVQAQRMMEQYPRLSPRVRLTYVDFISDPTFAARYPDLTLSQGDVLVTCGDRKRQLKLTELFNIQPQGESLVIHSSRAEEALTSAIAHVTGGEQVRVAMLTGYGSASMTDFVRLLEMNNYEVTQVNLTTEALDATYDLALLLGPRIDLSEDALGKLDTFLYNRGGYGKTLFYTADVTQQSLPNLEAFLEEWGVVVGDGAVFETAAARTYQYQPFYAVADYVDRIYRDRLIDPSAPVLMPLARPLTLLYESQGSRINEVLLQYAETSGVRPSEALDGFTVEQAERWGPMPALVIASRRTYCTTGVMQSRSNVVVSASTAMLDTFSIHNTSLSNSEYLVNLFNTLCARTDVVSIRPKSLAGGALSMSTAQGNILGIVMAGVLPLMILAIGLVIWLVRRYQ